LTVGFYIGSVAAYVLGVLPAVAAFILGPGAVKLLLLPIAALKIVRVLLAPAPVIATLVLPAARLSPTGALSVLDPRIRFEQPTTYRTPPSLLHHTFPLLLPVVERLPEAHQQRNQRRNQPPRRKIQVKEGSKRKRYLSFNI
jgi:hypothetical protein